MAHSSRDDDAQTDAQRFLLCVYEMSMRDDCTRTTHACNTTHARASELWRLWNRVDGASMDGHVMLTRLEHARVHRVLTHCGCRRADNGSSEMREKCARPVIYMCILC